MSPVELFAQPVGHWLTLALVHFLWQGFAVVFVLVAMVRLCGIRRAAARYASSLAALLVMALSPLVTLAYLSLERTAPVRSAHSIIAGEIPSSSLSMDLFRHMPLVVEMPLGSWLVASQPYVLGAWLAGVVLFGGRLLIGAMGMARLRRGRMALPQELEHIVERLGRRLRMNALPAVFFSRQVADAMATGLMRPLILIPAAWATEMSMETLEAVIAHELAHLRRRDLWINLLQRVLETLLFYHPAVWWLSRRLRTERELCTDELAVAATGRRLVYAKALEHVAQWRQVDERPALAAYLRGETNMQLLARVQNVLGLTACERTRLWPAGLLALMLPLGLWMMSVGVPVAVGDDDRDEVKAAIERRVRLELERLAAKEGKEDNGDNDEDEADEAKRIKVREVKPKKVEDKEAIKDATKIRFMGDKKEITKEVEDKVRKNLAESQPGKAHPEGWKPVKRGGEDQRIIEELADAVKQLAAQVKRLQEEVAELRGDEPRKGSGKGPPLRVRKFDDGDSADKRDQEVRRSREVAEEDLEIAREKWAILRAKEAAERAEQQVIRNLKLDEAKIQKAVEEALKAKEGALEQAERAKAEAAEAVKRSLQRIKERRVASERDEDDGEPAKEKRPAK